MMSMEIHRSVPTATKVSTRIAPRKACVCFARSTARREDAPLSAETSSSTSSRRAFLSASLAFTLLGANGASAITQDSPAISPESKEIARLYDRYAATYDLLDGGALATGLGYDELRNQLIGQAKGTILEVGVGTGLNLPYYRWTNVASVTASDVSLEMITQAMRKANSDARVIGAPVAFQPADVSSLPFPDATFDTVIDTFSLCVFPDPRKALKEMVRVVKPGGRLLLLEHTRSDNPLLGFYQDITNSYVKKMSKECSWNQNVPQMVSELNVKNVRVERYLAGTVVSMTLANPRKTAGSA